MDALIFIFWKQYAFICLSIIHSLCLSLSVSQPHISLSLMSLCVCICVSVCVCMCVCCLQLYMHVHYWCTIIYVWMMVHMYAHTCERQRLILNIFFNPSPPYTLRKGPSMNLELINPSKVLCQTIFVP